MKLSQALSAVVGLAALVRGHMEMTSPAPLRSKYNANTPGNLIDYSMTSPLSASGGDFPCKGSLNLLGQPAAKPVAAWTPGQTVTLSIAGSANHGGGSCQASLSYDQGKTFKVVYSWIGNCPTAGTSSWSFLLPADTPAGEALFAWTWFNQVGNREMYMNCAVVTVKAGKKRAAEVGFSSRPDIFVANVGNGVCTYEGSDVAFPQPGPNVVQNSAKGTRPPGTGSCDESGGGYVPPIAAPVVASPAPAPSPVVPSPVSQGPPVVPSPAATTPSSPRPSVPGGMFITKPIDAPAPTHAATAVQPAPPQVTPPNVSGRPQVTPPTPGTKTVATSALAAAPTASPAKAAAPSDEGAAGAAGTACSVEGQWSCAASGKEFQRCASGVWSAPIAVAGGTSCKPGVSDEFVAMRKRGRGIFVRV